MLVAEGDDLLRHRRADAVDGVELRDRRRLGGGSAPLRVRPVSPGARRARVLFDSYHRLGANLLHLVLREDLLVTVDGVGPDPGLLIP